MLIDEAAKVATASVRSLKELAVRKAKGRVDLDTTIVCYRGDEPAAIITLPPHRQQLLQIAHLAAAGFSADVMTVTHDSYMAYGHPDEVKDPRTGKLWVRGPDGPGSMQTYVEEHGFDGLVVEGLTTYVLNRAGDCKTVMQPYEVDGRAVTWLPTPPGAPDGFVGDIPEGLKAAMDGDSVDQILAARAVRNSWLREKISGPPDKVRFHMDMGTLLAIEEKATEPVVVKLFAKPGTPRDQLFRTKLARSQIINPSHWN